MLSINKLRLAWMTALIGAIAGCNAVRAPAPVVDRTPPTRGTEAKPKSPQAERPGFYTVKRGDTLYRIALEFKQNYRDLVIWNNLSSPDDIKVDQVLRVLPADTGTVRDGPQTGGVASGTGIEVRPLGQVHAAASGSGKSGPRGDKRPYSEAALAELQKPDVVGHATASEGAKPATPAQEARAAQADRADKAEKLERGEKAEKADRGDGGQTAADDSGVDWMWPAEGKLLSAFDAGKKGIDIAGKMGQPVVAAGAGKVLYAGRMRGYGNLVIVKHTNSLLSAYAHGKTILVKEGQTVTKGQKIAEMGNSDSDTVKLHFEIRQQGKPVDPAKYLPNR